MPQIPDYIQTLQTQFESETQPFKKVHRLIDLCEAVIKFHTVVILSNFMESMANNTHSQEDIATARGILAQGLKTPSLGIWAFFTEKIFPLIPKEDLFWEDFPAYFEKTLKKASAEIIPFRNSYAHGSTPDDKECLADIQKILPHLDKILKGGIVDRYDLRVGEVIKGTRVSWIVSLEKEGRSLVLSPLLVYRDSEKGVVVRQAHHDTMGGSTGERSTKKSSTGLSSGGSTGSPTDANKSFPEPVEGTDTQNSNTNPNSGGSTGSPTGAKESVPEPVEGTDIQNSNTNPNSGGSTGLLTGAKKSVPEAVEGTDTQNSNTNPNSGGSTGSPTGANKTVPEPVEGTDIQNSSTNPNSGGSTGSPTGAKKSDPEPVEGTIPKRFFYFNDLRNEKKISLLNYDASEHIRDEELKKAFDEIFPLKSWEKKSVSPFKSRIEELTENFKGRREELKQLETFFREEAKGHFFIWGGPGIGKSTLVARALQLSRASQEKGGATEEEAFAVGKDIHFIEYFIRRGTDHARTTTYLKYMSEEMERVQSMGIPTGVGQDEMGEKYFEKLRTLSEKLEEKNKKLVLFIDGLDEADDGFLRYLPMEGYKQILVVLSTRELPLTREIYLRILENKEEITLHGLGTDVIRALLYDVVDKYDIQKEYIDGILTKSEGNPLYLRLLLNSLAEKEKKLNDISALPKGVYDFYQEILDRLNKSRSGADIDDVLYLLTITKDYLSADTISYFTGIKRNKVDIILSDIREILFENPFTEEVEDFQLFHESLREFFKEKYPKQLIELRDSQLFPKLRNWKAEYTTYKKDKTDPYTIRYILSYTVSHFLESLETLPEAETLVLSKEYVDTQLDVLQFYTIPLRDAGLALKQIVSELGGKPCTTRPLSEILKPKKSKDEKFRTTTFVQLVNHTGELSHKASTDIGIAWKWIEEGKVSEALERLSPIQDKQRLFDCYLLALWLLTLQPDGGTNRAGLKLVLEEVEKNIPPAESKTVKWHERYSEWFFAELCKTLLMREQVVKGVFDRGNGEQKKDVILTWLGYEKIGDAFEHTKFEEERVFIQKCISKFIALARGIESSRYSRSLSSIGESVSKLGDVELGRSLFPVLIEVARGIEDSDDRSSSLRSIGESVSKLGDVKLGRSLFQESVEVARGIESSRYRSEALSSIGESVSKLGDVELGRSLFQESVEVARGIESSYSRSRSLSSIGESVSKLGDVELGRSLFQESVEVARGIENSYGRRSSLSSIGESVSKLGDVELGRSLFPALVEVARGIESSDDRSRSLSSIGESVSKLGDVELGRSLFQESVEVARGIEDSDGRSSSLSSIGESVSKLGDVELGRSLFPSLVEVARGIESSYDRSRSLRRIGESVSKLGDVELGRSLFQESVEVARGIKFSYDRSSSLSSIGESVSKLGDVELGRSLFQESVEVARGIEDSDYRSSSLRSIGESVSKLGDVELGRSLFQESVEVARGIDDSDVRSLAIGNIGESVAKFGDEDFGKNLFPELVEVARGIDNFFGVRSEALSSIGESVSKLGDVELGRSLFQEAVEVARSIEKSWFRSKALSSIGKSVSKLGDVELGLSLFQEAVEVACIGDSDDRGRALCDIVVSVEKLGESDTSNQLLPKILELGYQLKVSFYRKVVTLSIAKATATFGSTTAYSFFETNHDSHPDIPEVVKAYTEEYRKLRWEDSKSQDLFSYYIRSFGWVPYDGEFAKKGAYDVISTLARLGKIDEALEAGRGIGMIAEAPASTEDEYARELAELDKLLEDEEITKKGYDKRVLELKGKYGI
jgi:hypothetical protein